MASRRFQPTRTCRAGINPRLAEKADLIERTGQNPDAASIDDVQELIDRRLGRVGVPAPPRRGTVDEVAALPVEALLAYADVLAVLELKPWAGEPQHAAHPEGAVRRWVFGPDGAGQVIYLIVEDGARSTSSWFSGWSDEPPATGKARASNARDQCLWRSAERQGVKAGKRWVVGRPRPRRL
jgi:hypothetical protein